MNPSDNGNIDWQQYQNDIWRQKCIENPEIYEIDIDHTKCKCCGKPRIVSKRKGGKKKSKKREARQ